MTASKGIPGDDVPHFGSGAKGNAGTKTEIAFDGVLKASGEKRKVICTGEKDDVTALDVRLRGFEFEGFVEGTQGVHLDFVVAADIDAAEHGDDGGHGERNYTANAVLCRAGALPRRVEARLYSKRGLRRI